VTTSPSEPGARLALATCAELPDLDPDDHALRDALLARGVPVDAVVWDDPTVDWASYPHVVIRSTWDYTARPRQFADWARRVERTSTLINPASAVTWNIDKTYLRDIERAGLPIVPTIWLDPERNFDARAIHTRFPAFGDFVVKPTISAGSRDTGRSEAGQTQSRSLAIMHAKNLLGVGRHVMIQRYLKRVDTEGETALIFVEGEFSHAVRKGALLEGPYRAEEHEGVLYRREVMAPREATPEQIDVASRVVAALPDVVPGIDGSLLYSRVDLIPDDAGNPVVLEVELIEPSLFFAHAPGSVETFADAIVARLR
jgi:glutathione synthase/RimK-type ligase-like ATP-grasp enzyme